MRQILKLKVMGILKRMVKAKGLQTGKGKLIKMEMGIQKPKGLGIQKGILKLKVMGILKKMGLEKYCYLGRVRLTVKG